MKSKKDKDLTYMGHLQSAWYASEIAEEQEIHQLLYQFRQFGNVIHHSVPLFYAIDYTAQQYLVMTEAMQTIAGYHPSEFIENRMHKLLEVYHKDDFKIYNQNVFANNLAFLKKTPQAEHSQHQFSYNFRFKRADQQYAHVLQRNSYITSKETGLPLYSLGVIMDISEVKTDVVIVQTIEKMGAARQVVEQFHYYPDQEAAAFSKREIGVLNYLAEGLSSKQIAGKLYISENTVINHKQNMMRKTNAKNTTELVVAAVRSRVI